MSEVSSLAQRDCCRSNRALLFSSLHSHSDCTKWWCGAICASPPATGEIQNFTICSVITHMGDPQTSREESLTLYVGPSRGRKAVSACVMFRRRAAPLRAQAGGLVRVKLLGTGLSVPRASGGPLWRGRPSSASVLPQRSCGPSGCEADLGVPFRPVHSFSVRHASLLRPRNQEGIQYGSVTPVQMHSFSSVSGVGRIFTCE